MDSNNEYTFQSESKRNKILGFLSIHYAGDYLKEVYCPKAFGEDKVCNIASYTTFGLKSLLIDMTRIFGKDRNEILYVLAQYIRQLPVPPRFAGRYFHNPQQYLRL